MGTMVGIITSMMGVVAMQTTPPVAAGPLGHILGKRGKPRREHWDTERAGDYVGVLMKALGYRPIEGKGCATWESMPVKMPFHRAYRIYVSEYWEYKPWGP